MSLIVVYFIVATFAIPQPVIDESLEECALYAEVYMNDVDNDYLDLLEELYGDVQAERTNPETHEGCDVPTSDR